MVCFGRSSLKQAKALPGQSTRQGNMIGYSESETGLSVPGAGKHQKVRVCWVFRPVAPPAPIAVRLSASGYCS